MAMSKKDFELAARALGGVVKAQHERDVLSLVMAKIFAASNERFDAARFYVAVERAAAESGHPSRLASRAGSEEEHLNTIARLVGNACEIANATLSRKG